MNIATISRNKSSIERVKSEIKLKTRLILKDRALYLLAVPGILSFIIFPYLPMYGVLIAFKNYDIFNGFWASDWVGVQNFQKLFGMYGFNRAFKNTIIISLMQLIFAFPVPIMLSIAINEVRNTGYKKLIQTSVYLPHFVSWMIISGILFALLSPSTGIVKEIANLLNYQGKIPNLLTSKEYFRVLLVVSNIWKEAGFGTVLYLATIASIDIQLYEAAVIDGAGKLKQIWHITLPGLRTTIIILLIFRMGQLLNSGADQIFAMYNPSVYEVSEILDTYVYKIGITEGNFKIGTTMGVFKSTIGLVLVLLTNFVAKKIDSDSGLV